MATKRATRRGTSTSTSPSSLSKYNAKRDLRASGEPGSESSGAGESAALPRFVIQKHDASRLHYDFRLEMAGVLRSWAVPKGLPNAVGEKVLAVEVEDHPLGYGDFEGTIPEGNYGAGTVMLWDRGVYSIEGDSPEKAFKKGKIHFALKGEKCFGEWTLVRMPARGSEKKNWLLIKNREAQPHDPFISADPDVSVKTGRRLNEISANAPTRKVTKAQAPAQVVDASKGGRAKRAALPSGKKGQPQTPPEYIEPMKALGVDEISGGEWLLEIKYDGYRALAVCAHGEVELWSRNHKSLSEHYPEIVVALKKLKLKDAVIDGEVVALDEEGRPAFQLLQNRGEDVHAPLLYYVFDLLHINGISLLSEPIETRKAELEKLLKRAPSEIRISPTFDEDPDQLLEQVRQQGLEGIVGKRKGSLYEPGRRSGAWAKKRISHDQEFVIGGFTPAQGGRTHFGALLVGYYEQGQLMFAGKVGTGFDAKKLKSLRAQFSKIETDRCPFANLPKSQKPRYGQGMTASAMREVTWLKPVMVAQIKFSEWTRDGSLRQPVFLGLREDKAAQEVVREISSG